MRRLWGTAIAAVAVALGAAAPADAAENWTAEYLPLPAGATEGEVDLTDYHGGFIGTARLADGYHVALWRDGGVKDLGKTNGVLSHYDSNRAGDVALTVNSKPYKLSGDRLQQLPLPAGASQATVVGVNERGDVLASSYLNSGPVLLLWPAGTSGAPTQLAFNPPHTSPTAQDVDDDGTVAFTTTDQNGTASSYYYRRDGRVAELPGVPSGSLPGPAVKKFYPGGAFGDQCDYLSACDGIVWDENLKPTLITKARYLYAVNASNTAVGLNDNWHPAVWTGDQEVVLGENGDARTIDDSGVVGGHLRDAATNSRKPVLWHH